MKSIITFVFVLSLLILSVGRAGAKKTAAEHDFIYKAAAQVS